mgnify:CR=1 FL=1
MEFDLARLQPKERASFALRALYEAAGLPQIPHGPL